MHFLQTCLPTLALCLAQTAYAVAIDMPDNICGAKTVSAEAAIELIQTMDELVLVDARISKDRTHGYIEGSVSLPDIETNCDSLWKIIPFKDTPALFYCNGIKCGRSVKSVKIALQCGYGRLYWFRGGYDEWLEKGYPYIKE